jgi:hypothetical protein
MGNFFTADVQPSAVVPTIRTPVLDGASGLHYSGRMYMNEAAQLAQNICQGGTATVDQIYDEAPNSISTAALPIDSQTNRIAASAVQGHVDSLVAQGLVPGEGGTLDSLVTADAAFYAAVKTEYCFYEARYIAALTQFLTLAAAPSGADQATLKKTLDQTIVLNKRLNSLLEIVAYVGNQRAQATNNRSNQIVSANKAVGDKLALLASQKDFLESSDATIRTQEAMIRYSAEKGRAMNIQIMFFVALNVVALGTVLTVYRSMP